MRYKNLGFRDQFSDIPSTTYLTHGIHSYTAKFIPHMPRYFILKYTQPGDIILDPFAGSGTTLLEAILLNRKAIGIDINPLARLISNVKSTPIDPEKLKESLSKLIALIKSKRKINYNLDFKNRDYWFSKKSVRELNRIAFFIEKLNKNKAIDRNTYNFFRLCLSSIIRKSSYADPQNPKTYCSPRMKKKREEGYVFEPIKYFTETLFINYSHMSAINKKISKKDFLGFIKTNDARKIKLPKSIKKVDLIVTSPPYANAQEYFRNIKLELLWLKELTNERIIKLDKDQIGGENHASKNYKNLHLTGIKEIDRLIKKIYHINKKSSYIVFKYFINMEKVIEEVDRVLKNKGHFIIIVGNNTVRGIKIPIHSTLIKIALNKGFKLHDLGYDNIRSRKFMTQRNNNADIIKKDWVIDLVKS